MTEDATWWVNGKPHLFSFAGLKSKADMMPVLYALFALFDSGLKMEVICMIAEENCVAAEAQSFGITKNGKRYENTTIFFSGSRREGSLRFVNILILYMPSKLSVDEQQTFSTQSITSH